MAGLSRVAARKANRTYDARRRKQNIVLNLILLSITTVVLVAIGMSAYATRNLAHPGRKPVDETPARLQLGFETFEFKSLDERTVLRSWFLASAKSDTTVILAHGFGSNRLEKSADALDLAKSLTGAGYNVLMFDFRAAGLSDGTISTLGVKEVDDLLGAVRFLQTQLPDRSKHIGVLGWSMGAAVATSAAAREPAIEAIVMDSPFADLGEYLDRNLAGWTHLSKTPFNWISERILAVVGVDPAELSPIRTVPRLTQPVLVIHGKDDSTIPKSDSERIVQAANSERVIFWEAPNSTPSWPSGVFEADSPACYHVAARMINKEAYDAQVIGFLSKNLGAAK